MILLYADQPLFGVVAKALHGMAADAFFAQAAEAVIAIALVLEYMHAVVLDVAAHAASGQQVGGGVVVVGFAVQLGVVRITLTMVEQTLGGVVGVVLVAFDTLAMALADEASEQAVVWKRLAGIAATAALGLGQSLDDQVVAGVLLVTFT
ncbi:hypothetical protein [Pseudomonas yamanorum]|uniref:hypothetical protein n=1 Tax=Pseudomonas yamanorum TaxID=515393 RepID=UPI003F751C6D